MTKIGSLVGALLVLGTVITGCSSSTTPGASSGSSSASSSSAAAMTGPEASTAPADGTTITISGMAFGEPISVAPGATVTIDNEDAVEHSVTSDQKGAFDQDVDGGKQATFTAPTEPGEYAFICTYHPKMLGTLIVK